MLKKFLEDQSKKSSNIKRVYQMIHRYGPITKVNLIERTNLKQTTMVRILDQLLEQDLIRIHGYDESSGGRPPALYQINANHLYIFGIDLSRTHTKIMLVNLAFEPVDTVSFSMTEQHTPSYTITQIKQSIEALMAKNNIDEERVLGIGTGAVGPLDRENGVILEPEYFGAPDWKQVKIVDELQKAFPGKVLLENGAHVAAIGEYYHADIPQENILYCISGIGLRCGILSNGQFVQNKTGDASSYGHMIIDVHDANHSKDDGEHRTLSSYISLESLVAETVNRINQGEHSVIVELVEGKVEECTIDHLFTAMRRSDPLVTDVIMKSAYYYGIGLANMVNVLHPEQVILSSLLIYELPDYYQKVTETAKKYVHKFDKDVVTFGKGYLKNDAVAIGASVLIFDTYFKVN